MIRQNCYDLCLYKLKISNLNIYNIIHQLKNDIIDQFNISPSGFGFSGVKKIRKYSDKTFAKLKEKKDIEDIVMFFGGDEGVNDDWLIYLELDTSCLTLILSTSFNKELLPFLKNVISKFDKEHIFDFGFIYPTIYSKLPEYYNYGVASSSVHSRLEKDKIRSWNINFNRKDGKYQPGDFRDVYPYNIISDLHLNRDVHGQTLESWIKSDRRHGALEKLTQTHWLWTIEDEHIPDAQDVLSRANLLVAYWELGK